MAKNKLANGELLSALIKFFLNLLFRIIFVITSAAVTLAVLNIYLGVTGQGKEDPFWHWEIDHVTFSPQYIYWDIPYCEQSNFIYCQTNQQHFLKYSREIYKPNNIQDCNDPLKIVFLGDSFTVGPFVDSNDSYPGVFSGLFAEYKDQCVAAYRVSARGVGNDQEFAVFHDVFHMIRPNIVIWQFFYNDVYDNISKAVYDVDDGVLIKRLAWENPLYLIGSIIKNIPLLTKSTLGKHLLYLSANYDLFKSEPVSFFDEHKMFQYNQAKLKLMFKEMSKLSEQYNFFWYTTLMPLECEASPLLSCQSGDKRPQDFMRWLLANNTKYLSVDMLGMKNRVNKASSLSSDYYFDTVHDTGKVGTRHLSLAGNHEVGLRLFIEYLLKNR